MRKVFIIWLSVFVGLGLHAQTFDEWFKQKKTDIKYLGRQIAALRIYLGWVEKGNAIVQQGLSIIDEIKRGDFNLHNIYYSSLKAVNPAIQHYSKVADIIAYEAAIIQDLRKLRQIRNMNASDIQYLSRVNHHMNQSCTWALAELMDLISEGVLEMKDADRIRRIDALWLDMKEKWAFTGSFTNEAQLLAAQRRSEENEIKAIKNLY